MGNSGNDRVVVISGANQGIGYHMLAALVADGYRVAGLDIKGTNISGLQDTIPEQVQYIECDVTKTADVRTAIAKVITQWGESISS